MNTPAADTTELALLNEDVAREVWKNEDLREQLAKLREERIQLAEQAFIRGCEHAGENISYDYAHMRWMQSDIRQDLLTGAL